MHTTSRSYHYYGFLSLTFLLLTLIFTMGHIRKGQEALAAQLAPEILRFHILANSDKKQDQDVKLEVRSVILDYVQTHMENDAEKEDIIQYLIQNRVTIESVANDYLKQKGFSYETRLEVVNCYFPAKAYSELSFPSGYYDAARITLGEGKGHNWWCVLYPRLCFVDAVCTEVPEETVQLLKQELGQGNYLALQDNRPEIQTRFFFLPMIQP